MSVHQTSTNHQRFQPWIGYVVPMATFLVLTTVEGWVPPAVYPYLYALKVLAVTLLLGYFRRPLQDIRPQGRGLLLALGVGGIVFGGWVWLNDWLLQWFPFITLGERVGFNPGEHLQGWLFVLFLMIRFFGLVIMVPVMEELFWRSFLLRYFSGPNFQAIPMGTFTWSAFGIVALTFGLAHNEWLVAILCAMVYALLLRVTRSLWACVIAHGVTNLALGIYVLTQQAWQYW